MNSVAVEVDNVHFALPVLLHIVGEHGVEDCGAGGEDVLVAPELPPLASHHTVGELALAKRELNLDSHLAWILTDSKMLEMSTERRETGSVARPVFPFTGLQEKTIK